MIKTDKKNDILNNLNTYVIQESISHCKICDNENDLRYGVCWNCAEAESIIVDGTDMYDKGLESNNVRSFHGEKGKPAQTGLEKLELLILKGWRYEQPKEIVPIQEIKYCSVHYPRSVPEMNDKDAVCTCDLSSLDKEKSR